MSERHSKQKSSQSDKVKESKSNKKSSLQEHKKHEIEGNTPPLPKNLHSLDELMKQRETLKDEIGKLDAKPDTCTKSKKRKHSVGGSNNSKIPKRNVQYSPKKAVKTRKKAQKSPEYSADKDLDSEDEETIIELRRLQRKQLLEKFYESDTSHKNTTIKEKNELITPKKGNNKIIPQENANSNQLSSDMFSEKDDFIHQNNTGATDTKDENNAQLNDNWDDAEGYLNVRAGDTLKNRYVLKEVLGKGVFAVVIHAQDTTQNNVTVAIKCVRNNDLMYRTSLKEISILKEINKADPNNKYHCVQYICDFIHKQHLCIVLEALHMDLRGVIKKYGKNHGIHTKALMSYSRQLLMALRLLKKIGIVHYDIKPDNILVNEKKNLLKLCDFGSAAKLDENEFTPYLVSRFYRAPEIILGIQYSHSIDIWSTACTIYEMATGRILFTGSSNNRMLKCFMDLKGKIPVKLIKKGKFKDQHFNYNNNFLLHKKDALTGRDKFTEICNSTVTRDLYKELMRSCKNKNTGDEMKRNQLKDLLDRMLMLDPKRRHTVTDCLKHSFIQDPLV